MEYATKEEEQAARNVYQENGYESRQDYLDLLAEDYGDSVYAAAELPGPNEDFDGLVTTLEDLC